MVLLTLAPANGADGHPGPAAQGAEASAPKVAIGSVRREGSRYVAKLEGGGTAELTLSPSLQQAADDVFRAFDVPIAAAVVLAVPDGRVLALSGRLATAETPTSSALALQTWAPAASVFKVVSAAALVSEAGLTAQSRTCYHGGVSSVVGDNLIDLPRLDRSCGTLGFAVGKSQNAIIAKLATKHLTVDSLERVASAFGFGQDIDFDAPVDPSRLDLPTDELEFARASAGFWHSSLSPLHGALLAAAIANGGLMPAPRLIARATAADGKALPLPRRRSLRVVDEPTAREVGRMMELTTRIGTARSTFRNHRGLPVLPVEVAGKTGSLAYRGAKGDPVLPAVLDGTAAPGHSHSYLGYSWFVGYAPVVHPRVAFAVVLGNRATWRIKAPYVARRLLTEYLAGEGDTRAKPVLAAR